MHNRNENNLQDKPDAINRRQCCVCCVSPDKNAVKAQKSSNLTNSKIRRRVRHHPTNNNSTVLEHEPQNDGAKFHVGTLKQFMSNSTNLYLHEIPPINYHQMFNKIQSCKPLYDGTGVDASQFSILWEPVEEEEEEEKDPTSNLKHGGTYWGPIDLIEKIEVPQEREEVVAFQNFTRHEDIISLMQHIRAHSQFVICRASESNIIELAENYSGLSNLPSNRTIRIIHLIASQLTSISTAIDNITNSSNSVTNLLKQFRDDCAQERFACPNLTVKHDIDDIYSKESQVMGMCKFLRLAIDDQYQELLTMQNRLYQLRKESAVIVICDWARRYSC